MFVLTFSKQNGDTLAVKHILNVQDTDRRIKESLKGANIPPLSLKTCCSTIQTHFNTN